MKLLALILLLGVSLPSDAALIDTFKRIQRDGYPAEQHKIQTADGYILTLYRIPYSPRNNTQQGVRPVAFLQHGLLSSSDCWLLNGPDNALGYLLADAGYDVWLGNTRGNTYSRKHAKYSPLLKKFWNFSWNEIAHYDIPAQIDFILYRTNQKSLHYVGHSQGTTVFFVLMSSLPHYQEKVRSAHLLAPVGYMKHMESPLARVAGPLLGQPNALVELFGSAEFLPSNKLFSLLGYWACKENSTIQELCNNVLFLICGYDQENLNRTMVPEIVSTHPAGSSVNQIIHYLQEYNSGKFRKFDYGFLRNKSKYKQRSPPDYKTKAITNPVYLYYSDNDYLASVTDVERLTKELPQINFKHFIANMRWNHLDFLWALPVKEIVFDKLIQFMNEYN